MSEWIPARSAVELISETRKVSVGAAIQLLIEACAQGVVRSQQRELLSADDWCPVIPAVVWRDAHLDIDTSMLYPAGVSFFEVPADEHRCAPDGGYGLGGNGIIEISESDLREYLRKPAPAKRGRKPKITVEVEQKVYALLDYHGLPNRDDPEWSGQVAVEKAIEDLSGVSRSTAREHARRLIETWNAKRLKKADN